MFTKNKRQRKMQTHKKMRHYGKSRKSGRSGKTRRLTRKSRKSRKSIIRRNKKYVGGGEWIDNDTLPKEDICPICHEEFSKTPEQAVYKTDCGHVFHNNCLNNMCLSNEKNNSNQVCPICRADLNTEKSDQCTDVWAFANEALDTKDLDAKNLALYEGKPPIKITRISDDDDDIV